MNKAVLENSSQNRYQEIVASLAKLSEGELHSFCLSESDLLVIQTILEYKNKKEEISA